MVVSPNRSVQEVLVDAGSGKVLSAGAEDKNRENEQEDD
jgi:hypothetical protein